MFGAWVGWNKTDCKLSDRKSWTHVMLPFVLKVKNLIFFWKRFLKGSACKQKGKCGFLQTHTFFVLFLLLAIVKVKANVKCRNITQYKLTVRLLKVSCAFYNQTVHSDFGFWSLCFQPQTHIFTPVLQTSALTGLFFAQSVRLLCKLCGGSGDSSLLEFQVWISSFHQNSHMPGKASVLIFIFKSLRGPEPCRCGS